jgi:thymidylate synthase (FAD)
MSDVSLVWATPEAEKLILYTARVSNPSNQSSENTKLINYCIKNKHWSVFEMASMCVEINTSRAIARQILRHKSLNFQEFSQRYANPEELQLECNRIISEPRRQDTKNRQNSIDDLDEETKQWFASAQVANWNYSHNLYQKAIEKGIAKECARIFLPEGQTPTRMYATGSLRSWIHYLQLRTGNGTQLEHQDVANKIFEIFKKEFPTISEALENTN